MGKSAAFKNDIQELIFFGTAIPGIAQNHASPATVYWLSLHVTDPTAGNQATGEVSYPGYGRVAVVRTTSGWEVVDNVAGLINNVDFPECTGAASLSAAYAGIGTSQTGTGYLMLVGALNPAIAISLGTTPRIGDTSTITEL